MVLHCSPLNLSSRTPISLTLMAYPMCDHIVSIVRALFELTGFSNMDIYQMDPIFPIGAGPRNYIYIHN